MGPLPAPGHRARALARDLSAVARAVSCEPADLWAASRDAWPRAILETGARLSPHAPDAVVWPQDTEEVAAVIRFAAERHIAVVPFGGGTGVVGGVAPV